MKSINPASPSDPKLVGPPLDDTQNGSPRAAGVGQRFEATAPRQDGSRARGSQAGTGLDGDRRDNPSTSASSETDRQAGSPGDPANRKPPTKPAK